MSYRATDELIFRQFSTLFRRRWKLIAASALIAGALAALIGWVIPARYTAEAQLLIEPRTATHETLDEAAVDTHVELLMSPSHLRQVQKSLASDPATSSTPDSALAATPQLPETLDFEELKKNINVFKERHSRVIAVTFTSTDPQLAANIANRIADLYVQRVLERAAAQFENAERIIAERIPVARAEMDRAKVAVREHRIAYGFVDSNDAELMDQKIAELRRQLEIGSSDLAERDAYIARLQGYLQREGGIAMLVQELQNPQLTELYRAQTATGEASRNRGALKSSALPVALDLEELQENIRRVIDQSLYRLTLDRNAVEARVSQIDQRLKTVERTREVMREVEVKLRELSSVAEDATQVYEGLIQRKTELLAQDTSRAEARIVSIASVPVLPSSPSPILFILPALVAAGMVGGVASSVLEHLDRRLRSERDIEDELGIPCIGLVPKTASAHSLDAQRSLIVDPFDPYTEAIRSVVATVLTQLSHDPMVCLVTSSEQAEGKTTLAISFAVYAALLRRRVLLIDLNFRNPGLSRALGLPNESGMIDILNGRPPKEVIKSIPELGIDYLPFSLKRVYPLEILSTDQLPNLLDHLKDQYDCIVIDSASLIGTTEARLFASLADKVFFVVKWGAIDAEVARGALQQLRHAGIDDLASGVSAVVTQVDMGAHVFGRYGEIGTASHVSAPDGA